MVIKAAAVQWLTFVYFDYKENKTEVKGIFSEFFHYLKIYLNTSISVTRAPDDNWDKMVQLLENKTCDITITPLIVSSDRAQRIDFSDGMTDISFVAITKSRNSMDLNDLLDYTSNVEPNVWFFTFLFALSIFLFNEFYKVILSPIETNFTTLINMKSYLDIWHLVPLFFEQSMLSNYGHKKFNKILLLMTVLCISILYKSVNSLISVGFILSGKQNEINSLKDIADSQLIPNIFPGSAQEKYFQNSKVPVHQQIWKRIQSNRVMANKLVGQRDNPNQQQFLDYLKDGKIALIDINLSVMTEKSRYCKIMPKMRWHVAQLDMYSTKMSLGFKKNLDDKLKAKINKLVKIFRSIGLVAKWFADLSNVKFDTNSVEEFICLFGKEDNENADFKDISLSSVKNLLTVLFSVNLCAFLIFLFEIMSRNRYANKFSTL